MASSATTLRQQTASSTNSLRQNTLKKNMSITQTYYLAHKARAKLSHEAAQPDHDLRLLVGHANLLDSLMIELADAEREQERWFNQSVRGANTTKTTTTATTQDRHIQWADTYSEEAVDDYVSDSEDSDDYDSDEDINMVNATPARMVTPKQPVTLRIEVTDDMEEDDLEEDYAQLELVRTPSHSPTSPPPELMEHDSDSSEDESMPPSPPQPALVFNDKAAKQTEQDEYYDDDYYVPQNPARLVTSIKVY